MASRLLLIALLVLALGGALLSWESLSDVAWWQQQLARCQHWCDQHPVAFTLGFGLLFALMSAITLPGCSVLALMAGPLFGAVAGTLLVGVACTAGATASFLVARHLARPAAQARFGHRLQPLERVLARHGVWSLFALRLVPLVPFPVLNPLLGLTRMPLRAFVWPSLAGLTLGTVPYVWLGLSAQQLASATPGDAAPLAVGAALLLATLWWLRQRLAKAVSR
jgi:uncharacterized membrane protein YdjX (TVP38/TMEM64 family)